VDRVQAELPAIQVSTLASTEVVVEELQALALLVVLQLTQTEVQEQPILFLVPQSLTQVEEVVPETPQTPVKEVRVVVVMETLPFQVRRVTAQLTQEVAVVVLTEVRLVTVAPALSSFATPPLMQVRVLVEQ
jgi:hypothetical protein